MTPFRFLYVTDLHGWTNAYERIFQIAQQQNITVIVNGGDMLPHAGDLILTQRLFIEEYLSAWCERLTASGLSCYAMLANDDCKAVLPHWRALVSACPNLYDLTDGWYDLRHGLTISGCNYIPDPPFRLKDWCVLDTRDYTRPAQHPNPIISEDGRFIEIEDIDKFFRDRPTLQELLDESVKGRSSLDRSIYVCHAPPYGTGLGNIEKNADVGSKAVLVWIEKHRPLLTLHGHIHESPLITGKDTVRIGQTTAHQPGQQRFLNRLTYSIVAVHPHTVSIERRAGPLQ
jgi:Icc-related predicted phosphoesterase